MSLPADFLTSLTCPHPKDVFERLLGERKPDRPKAHLWTWRAQLSPADLYCYLGGRFGCPNGPQSFFRSDDSDNLIHWHWVLDHPLGEVQFLGMSYRTEVWASLAADLQDSDSDLLASLIKADFSAWGKKMAGVRANLERWTEFVNPYRRLSSAVEKMLEELRALDLRPEEQEPPDRTTLEPFPQEDWDAVLGKYSKGLGLCFGIRSMLPVLAEAYVNFLLFALLRPEIKTDDRLRENTIRQPIDVRVKSLHINCIGFAKPVDYASPECKAYHSLVNERNDLLHGNVVLEKLRFNDIYFDGTVPVFKTYQSMWQRSVGVEIGAVGLHRLESEVKTVNDFCLYLTTCMRPEVKEQIDRLSEKRDLGWNEKTGRIGVLFPDHLVDMQLVLEGEAPTSGAA